MKKIMTLFIAVALIASMSIGAIAGANEDAFADAVNDEQAQLALEKAAVEFAKGNDVEGFAAEEDVNSSFGKTQLGFHRLAGAVITASYFQPCPGFRIHKPRPLGVIFACFVSDV